MAKTRPAIGAPAVSAENVVRRNTIQLLQLMARMDQVSRFNGMGRPSPLLKPVKTENTAGHHGQISNSTGEFEHTKTHLREWVEKKTTHFCRNGQYPYL